MVMCRICNKQFKMITNTHLKKAHRMTTEEYLCSFPDAELCDEDMRAYYRTTRKHAVKPVCARPTCNKKCAQTWNTYCSRYCSMSHRMSKDGRDDQGGAKNWKFNGGWYSIGKSQKQKARERDNYFCQRCSVPVRGKNAQVHHIVPERCFDDAEMAHALDNLITLCGHCHKVIEWENLREVYRRVYLLDELQKGNPNWQTFEDFKKVMLSPKDPN